VRLLFDVEADDLLDNATTIHSIVIRDLDTDKVYSCHDHGAKLSIADGIKLLSEADMLVGHNILNYDLPVIKKLYPKFRRKPGCVTRDTLLITRLIWTDISDSDFRLMSKNKHFPARLIGSHSLEAWGFRLGVLKSDFGKTSDFKQWSPQMQTYCEQDVEVNVALWDRIVEEEYSEEAIQLEHDFAAIIYRMCDHGFAFNREAATELYGTLVQERDALNDQLQEVFLPTEIEMKKPAWYRCSKCKAKSETKGTIKHHRGCTCKFIVAGPPKIKKIPFNPGSRTQVAERLMAMGWKPTKKTDAGRVAVDDGVLASIDIPEAAPLKQYFLVTKRIGQVATGKEAWLLAEKAGRVYYSVITNGAVTGRCAHVHFNIAQVPKVDSPYGTECRSLFIASEGMVLVGADASGIEARCLAHYLAKYDGGEYVKEVLHGDIHTKNQAAFGLAPGKPGRGKAKNGFYCKTYGGGPEKLGSTLGPLDEKHERAAQSAELPAWLRRSMLKKGPLSATRIANAKRGLYAGRRIEQGINGLAELLDSIRSAVRTRGWIRGLDGRRLRIRSDHSALNTLLQSAGALIVKKATVLWYNKLISLGLKWGRDFALVAHVHDEIQVECLEKHAKVVGETFREALAEAGRLWKFRCPLDGEYKIGRNWAETH
jgi:DNA polymerase-1